VVPAGRDRRGGNRQRCFSNHLGLIPSSREEWEKRYRYPTKKEKGRRKGKLSSRECYTPGMVSKNMRVEGHSADKGENQGQCEGEPIGPRCYSALAKVKRSLRKERRRCQRVVFLRAVY